MSPASAFDRAEAANGRPVARVLLDSALPQLDHLFDYAVPQDLAAELRVGQRVRVPFRSQQRKNFGYIVGFADRSEFSGSLAEIADTVGPVPVLSPEVWRLARAVSDRAGGSAGDILRLAIPPRQLRVEKKHLAGEAAELTAATVAAAAPVEVRGPDPEDPGEAAVAEGLVSGARLAHTASHGPERLATGEWVGG